MFITIEPGQRVDVPLASDYLVRCASSFTLSELAQPGVVLTLPYRGPAGEAGSIAGYSDGTDLVFPVTPDLFGPGEWTANPRAFVNGKVRRWPEPVTLVVEDALEQEPDDAG